MNTLTKVEQVEKERNYDRSWQTKQHLVNPKRKKKKKKKTKFIDSKYKMERKYKDGTKKDITYFIGTEIEKTAYGMKTLFVRLTKH